jgi:hypothetical protein
MKLLNIFLLITLTSIFSCKKEEEPKINPCANGQQDNGETEIDCGGPCKACTLYPYLIYRLDGVMAQSTKNQIYKEGEYWYLGIGTPGINYFQINLGTSLEVGSWDVNAFNTAAIYQNMQYTFDNGFVGISENDTINRRLSGNFDVHLKNGTNFLSLEDGKFEYISY